MLIAREREGGEGEESGNAEKKKGGGEGKEKETLSRGLSLRGKPLSHVMYYSEISRFSFLLDG